MEAGDTRAMVIPRAGLQDLDDLRHGIAQARRGWLTKDDVLNSRPLKDLLPLLRRTFHA